MDPDSTLCFCFHIRKRKIVNFVKQTRPRRASQISDCFGAGTGCGWCIPFLKRIHRDIVADDIVESDDVSAGEYEAMRRSYLAGIKDGTRIANSAETEGPPPELEALDDGRREYYRSWTEPRPDGKSGPPEGRASASASDDPDWDVTDYFTRRREQGDAEPDDLVE